MGAGAEDVLWVVEVGARLAARQCSCRAEMWPLAAFKQVCCYSSCTAPAPLTPRPSFPLAHLVSLVPTNLPADGECEEVYNEAHVLALGTYTKEW